LSYRYSRTLSVAFVSSSFSIGCMFHRFVCWLGVYA
jgi:hypothetical protein